MFLVPTIATAFLNSRTPILLDSTRDYMRDVLEHAQLAAGGMRQEWCDLPFQEIFVPGTRILKCEPQLQNQSTFNVHR